MADKPKDSAEKPFIIERPVRHVGMEKATPLFADAAVIRHTAETFSLFFFQAVLPVTEDKEQLKRINEVELHCVSRIVLSPSVMREFYGAITRNLEKWKKLTEANIEQAEHL